MTSHNPPTTQQLDDIETRARAATPGPWTVELEQCDCSDGYCHHGTYVSAIYAADGERRTEIGDFPDADWQFTIHARTDVPLLLAEVRRLNARVGELEPAAMQARAALAALCYDLDDPGTDALGALYVIQQATIGTDRPQDDAAAALARRDAEVMRRCAEFVRDTYFGDDIDDAAATLERDADVVERGCRSEEGAARGLANCPRCGRLSAKHPIPAGFAASGSV